jgi:hypothetical protein
MISKIASFFILLNLLSGRILCQNHYYDLLPNVPSNYSYDPDKMYQQYLNANNGILKGKDIKEYAEVLSYYHSVYLNAGLVYFNWSEVEDYLQKIVNKIKETNNITKELKVYLIRDEDNNATASDNGIVYVYIGLLANIPDEAALVSVLGHEISHALNNDQRSSFQLENKFKKRDIRSVLSRSHGNRAFEARSDEYGFKVATNMGYDIRSEYNAIIKFESDYRWYKSQYGYEDPKWHIYVDKMEHEDVAVDSLDDLLSSHPDNFKRIAAMRKFVAIKNGENKFIEDKLLFSSIQYKARVEQLYIDFREGDYIDCLKNAFYYHLIDQKNTDYIYYVTESLRRLLLYEPKLTKKGFLTHESKDPVFEKNKGILRDISYLSLDSNFIAAIAKDTVYGKQPKPFETYLQAYNFFIKKSATLKVTDVDLTEGLFALANRDADKAKLNFKKYTGTSNAKYKEFANAYLDGSLFTGFDEFKKNLFYISEPNYFYREDSKINYSFIESENYVSKTKEMFNEVIPKVNAGNNELLYEDTLNIIESNFYSDLLSHLHSFKTEKEAQDEFVSLRSHQDNDYWNARAANDPKDPEVLERQKNFFYLNPEYWKFFKDKAAASITKITPYIYNVKTPTGTKTYFYLELAYYNPYYKKYVYYEQEYLEKFTKENVKKVLKKMFEKVNFKTN